ncbi:hypothetical protein [Streptococcus salivarius]
MSDNVPRLTGGILFGLILAARKARKKLRSTKLNGVETDKSDGLNEDDMMVSFIEIVTGESFFKPEGVTFKKNVSDYKKCVVSATSYLTFDDQTSIESFETSVEQNKKDTLERMSAFISDKFSEQKMKWFVSAIIETICDDETIDDSEKFKISLNESKIKQVLLDVKLIEIESFLLDVMRYIFVNKLDNTLGKPTFEAWYSQSGERAPWKLTNADLGKHMNDLEITRYNPSVKEFEEQEHVEESDVEIEEEFNSNVESDNTITKQVLNNPQIINQHANNVNNIVNYVPSRTMLPTDGFYNLFVKYDEKYEGACFTIPRKRILNWTTEQISAKFSKFSFEDVEEIKSLPALFLPEYKENENISSGYLGSLEEINIPKYGDPVFHFKTTKSVPVDWVNIHKDELMIAPFELDNTHWAIKRANLMSVLEGLTNGNEAE